VVGITDGEGTVVIGDGVNIETGAQVEAAVVGDGTSIEVRAIIGKGAVLGKVGEYLGFVCRSA
jgi:dynactin-6